MSNYRAECRVLIRRVQAKKVKVLLGGAGYITHHNAFSTAPVQETDRFIIVIYHPDLMGPVNKITGYRPDDWEEIFKPQNNQNENI